MGKKRRSTSSRASAPLSAPEINSKNAKLAAINSWEDVADDEDAFHLQRDAIAFSANDRGPREGSDEDEEVMGLGKYGYEDNDEEDDDGEKEERPPGRSGKAQESSDDEEREEEVEEGWGSSKRTYYGGNEEVDAEAEEEEARRIQQKQMAAMSMADFAFDDADWAAPTATDTRKSTIATVVTEQLPTKLPDAPENRIKLLHTRYPEFQPLSEEFLALQKVFPALEMGAMAAETAGETESPVVKKWKVASAYLGVLSMYFAILTEAGKEDNGAIDRVREHPIMSALLGVRSAWEKVKRERVERIEARLEPVLEENEAEKGRKRKLAGQSDTSDGGEEAAQVTKKARAAKEDFSDLDVLTAFAASASKPKRIPRKAANNDTDFGEDAVLNDIDAEEKTRRKKNLRFYTSQINAKSTKRDAASRGAGGDADIPHKERRKERELRLQAEAQRRRDKGEGADLSDNEPEPAARKSESAAPDDDPDNEYYSLLASASQSRKEEKKKLYEAEKAAKKEGNMLQVVEGALGPDGKREIGWKIMKNKGLTPKRKKEVRNPRVKKKVQYEKKMKKVSSQKAVYKGGLQGAYGGEATGIKKNLVKSVKFAS